MWQGKQTRELVVLVAPNLYYRGYEPVQYARISIDQGTAEYMTKPFHPFALVEKVKAVHNG